MKYFSLFSGIGGFELGMPKNYECVGFSEINKFAIKIYQKHFSHHKNYGDIRAIATLDIPDFDFLCGGFPCQSFSVAGKRRGLEDVRGTLFFEIARILRDKNPRYFLLENVKGLLSHDAGKTFKTMVGILTDLGYCVQWVLLNSKDFGVPQNRERIFIVGNLRTEPKPKIFLLREDGKVNHKPTKAQKEICNTAQTLTTRSGGNGQGTHIIERAPLRFLQRNQKNIDGNYSFTVDTSNTGGVRIGDRIRRFTPLECERLQGFPDGWTAGVSDSQRYRMLGNAVTVNVIRYLMNQFEKISCN